ncbi:MAG: T9SS type A sorting domain-containing protein, partial [Chitinophagales bacterium]|nr:T9SS type A sorting domain-containing protein [Chitinophagales bacterium]
QLGFGVPNFKVAYDILELRAFNQENGLILYPNPTYNYLYLTFIEETAGTYDLLIADKSGKVWESQRDIAATTIVKLNLLDLPVGAYHVFVKQGKNKFSQQFVKR